MASTYVVTISTRCPREIEYGDLLPVINDCIVYFLLNKLDGHGKAEEGRISKGRIEKQLYKSLN
jgi:hypothetical protein